MIFDTASSLFGPSCNSRVGVFTACGLDSERTLLDEWGPHDPLELKTINIFLTLTFPGISLVQ